MGENSTISWTDHTWNPWIGCQEVSPACDHCYAKRQNNHRQWVKGWGPHGERRRTSDAKWLEPLSWDRKAAKLGIRYRVFCASLADVFDNRVPAQWHADVWQQIRCTPNLDWMLLTKRPQNIAGMLPEDWDGGYPNVWLGTTVENQAEADRRIPHLIGVPARIRFLSCEPMLGPIDLQNIRPDMTTKIDATTGASEHLLGMRATARRIDWVIAGGESGGPARPSHPDWFRSLRDQCQAAGVAFHFKQWGEWAPGENCGDGPTRTERTASLFNDTWDFGTLTPSESRELHRDDEPDLFRIGVKRAGRMLDGVTHGEFPVSP